MAEWYQKAYKGGGPVQAPFPRPLYPPDANKHGKKPSPNGPDVVAYKRALCRAGRWGTWDPSKWDDAYSNAFSHGKGGNVKDTGVAGFQRQQDIDDTGWLGKTTFNNMRYALISDPDSPHFGEPIFDSVCIDKLNQAYGMFGGVNPPESGVGTVRKQALSRAVTQLGVKESPPDTNNVKYCSWYGMTGPWCAMFMTWCFELGAQDIAKDSPSFKKGVNYSYVPYIVGDARAARNGLRTVDSDQVQPGDLVCYDWQRDGTYDHVGVFEKWITGAADFQAIEGNTSADSGGSQSNGGGVYRRTRNVGGQGTVFVRVAEP